ncbi:MAG: hypothetical protein Q7J26_02875 [Brevundimonas sp.]|uniref:hypothetical protein n=1 Tax=Brevundimonas sp. TaxID=1871086 RepID=UPI0027271FAE|nr:hypothetical protein [Brevundimonas sp.]MDO9607444.1 hypothetical protein [Brevundimonas sp.]
MSSKDTAHPGNRRWRRANAGKMPVQTRPALPAVIPEHILWAPEELDFGPEKVIDDLYFFFDELRFRAISLRQRVIVDLRQCTRIGPVGVLLLAAEITRCNHAHPDSVTGYSPDNVTARRTLSVFGFFEAVGLEPDEVVGPLPGYYQIQSGIGRTDDLSAKLGDVAALTRGLWNDQAFSDRIHGALNEAMTNVLMHAYDPVLLEQADACESGRWWVAGMASRERDDAWFMALDLGVGMPVSAPAKNKDLRAYLTKPIQRTDASIIWHLVTGEGRSRTGLPQHGKGIPTMVSLIRDRVDVGTLWIVSGLGLYLLDKNSARSGLKNIEISRTLKARSAGTLILWKVGRPIMIQAKGS